MLASITVWQSGMYSARLYLQINTFEERMMKIYEYIYIYIYVCLCVSTLQDRLVFRLSAQHVSTCT